MADADDAERLGVLAGDRDGGHRRPGAVFQVLGDHLPGVHPVDVVGPEHHHDVRLLVVDQVHRLVDGVGRAAVPVRAQPLLGRHRGDVVAQQVAHPPGDRDMPVQAVALVLGQDADLPDAGIGQVRQREVDQPVHPAERHRGLGPVVRQRRQPRPRAAGQHDPQYPRVRHVVPPPVVIRDAMVHPLAPPAEPGHPTKTPSAHRLPARAAGVAAPRPGHGHRPRARGAPADPGNAAEGHSQLPAYPTALRQTLADGRPAARETLAKHGPQLQPPTRRATAPAGRATATAGRRPRRRAAAPAGRHPRPAVRLFAPHAQLGARTLQSRPALRGNSWQRGNKCWASTH